MRLSPSRVCDASAAPSVEAASTGGPSSISSSSISGDPIYKRSIPRPRHYRNMTEPGACIFFTTTALDFARAFQRHEMAERMTELLFEVHEHFRAALHAFVVMPEHIHCLTKLPHDLDGPTFVGRLKSYTAHHLRPLLLDSEAHQFRMQRTLGRREFWQRSFRSVSVSSERIFSQKRRYIHLNPVRRSLVESADTYRWSSAWLYLEGLWDDAQGLRWPGPIECGSNENDVQEARSLNRAARDRSASTDGAAEASNRPSSVEETGWEPSP